MYMYMLWDMDYVCGVCMDVAYTVWCMYVVYVCGVWVWHTQYGVCMWCMDVVYGCGIHSMVYVCGVWMWCMGVCCDVV